MVQRLSPRESRRLARRLLGQDERAPRAALLFAGGATAPLDRSNPEPPRPARTRGPYELEYAISAGYTTERTIVVP